LSITNEVITIPGTSLGGATPANDAKVKVIGVGGSGDITEITITGTAAGSTPTEYTNVSGTGGSGSSATFDIQDDGDGTYSLTDGSGSAGDGINTAGTGYVSSKTLTSSASEFSSGDVGKTIMIKGAGQSGNDLYAKVDSYTSGTEIDLDTAASTTVSSVKGFMTDVSQCRFQMVAGPEDGEHRFMHFAGEVYKNNFPFVNVRHFAKDFKATASSTGSTGSGSGSITLEARDGTTISANQDDVTLTATNGDVVLQAPSGQITFETLAVLKDYASTALPTGVNGAIISINDNNYKPAYYNGSTWKYIADDTDV